MNSPRLALYFTAVFLTAGQACALETMTSLDDGFAIPSVGSMIESSLLYPGTESFIDRAFAVCAWRIPFGINELAVTSLHTGINLGKAGISASFNSSGFDLYGEEQEKIGLSFSPYKGASAGVRLTRNAMRIKGLGQAEALSADIGFVLHPFDTVFISAAFEDIVGAELGKSNEPRDGLTRFAAAWNTSKQIPLLFSVTKVRRFDPSYSGGFTVDIMNTLTLGVVGGNEPDRFEFLGTVMVSGVHFSYRGSHNSELGMSHGFSVGWGYN